MSDTNEKLDRMIKLLRKKKSEISKEESYEIFSYYKQTKDKELLGEIVSANERLVTYMLGKYSGSPDYEDILQEGRIGLMLAVQKYDPDLGYAFSTLATRYILGYASKFAYQNNGITIPVYVQAKMRKIQKILDNNPSVTDKELAKEVELPVEQVKKIKSTMRSLVSLDVFTNEDGDSTLLDMIPSTEKTAPQIVEENETLKILENAILQTASTENRKNILRQAFGFDGEQKKCSEIAQEKGISYQYVTQVVNQTVWRMRDANKKKTLRKALAIPPDVKDVDVPDFITNQYNQTEDRYGYE